MWASLHLFGVRSSRREKHFPLVVEAEKLRYQAAVANIRFSLKLQNLISFLCLIFGLLLNCSLFLKST